MTTRLKELIDERRDLAHSVKEITVSIENNSKLYHTLQNMKEPRSISKQEVHNYEITYLLKLPEDVSNFLITYGTDGYLNHSIIDFKTNKIWRPEFYLSDSFYKRCIVNKIDDGLLDDFSSLYIREKNLFKNELLDKTYEEINRDYSQIDKLVYLGRSDCGAGDFLCLEGEFTGLIVHNGNWASKNIEINGVTYSKYHYGTFGKTYFEYLEELLESANNYLRNEVRNIVKNK